jgi:hypothetical protein
VGDAAAGDEDGGARGEEAEREDGAVPAVQLADGRLEAVARAHEPEERARDGDGGSRRTLLVRALDGFSTESRRRITATAQVTSGRDRRYATAASIVSSPLCSAPSVELQWHRFMYRPVLQLLCRGVCNLGGGEGKTTAAAAMDVVQLYVG